MGRTKEGEVMVIQGHVMDYDKDKMHPDSSLEDRTAYYIDINSYWVSIVTSAGTVVFKREPSQDNWLDAKHEAITKALAELETALINATRQEKDYANE
jgi:putative intracellular protease/amidase